MKKDFRAELKKRPLVFDGGMGTMLQALGLKPGGSPDELNLTEPEIVQKVHAAYAEAGADIITTNTFGATRTKLTEYGLEGKLKELNIAAARNVRTGGGADIFIAGGLGPTGRFIEPVGDMTFDEAYGIFHEQALALKEGGVDLIIIETMMDIKEIKAAIIAVKEVGLPVIATMTFDASMRTVLGTTPEVFAVVADSLGVDALGANCSLGAEGIFKALSIMSSVTELPLIAQPNAGLPELKGEETIFPASPEEMAEFAPKFAAIGVRILGGCCGTTAEHIKKMGGDFKALQTEVREVKKATRLASRSGTASFGRDLPSVVIGERINPTGRKKLAAEIKAGKTTIIRKETREQTEAGADVLDVNVGVPEVDEVRAMKRAVFCVNENSTLPIVIDSSDVASLEEGLKSVDGKALVNSVSGEEKKLKTVLPLVKKYGAAVLGLTLNDAGIPKTAKERVEVAKKILDEALKLGIKKEDVVIDSLAMTISAEPKGALETLSAIELVTKELGLSTALGVSNISFGLPSRETVNSNFYAMALSAGLTSAIINPKNTAMMDAYHASMVLLAKDARAGGYINRFKDKGKVADGGVDDKLEEPKSLKDRIIRAVVDGDEEHIVSLVEEALSEGWDPLEVGNGGLILGLNEVGKLFADNTYFLPQVILSADTVKKAFARLKVELKDRKDSFLGKVIMATVEGDIHDIGKNIVCTLLENHGFEVIDLGKNVSAEKIVDTARERDVDVVGLSALMTTTVMEMDNVIKKLKAAGLQTKTIVGGAVVTKDFAERIGADEYGGEATEAVEKIKQMVKG